MTKPSFVVIITGMGTTERGGKGGIGQRCAAQQESPIKGDSYCYSNGIAPTKPWRFWESAGAKRALDARRRLGTSRRHSEPVTEDDVTTSWEPGRYRIHGAIAGQDAGYDN